MPKGKPVVSADVKQQILNRIKNDGVPIAQIAQEHGISQKSIYNWLAKGVEGQPTWMEVAKLKKENRSLKELLGALLYERDVAQKKG